MKLWLGLALLLPLICMLLGLRTRKYAWNCALTLSCAAIVACTGRLPALYSMVIGLCVSVIGDFFMAHKAGRTSWYLAGIGGFFVAHVCFVVYAAGRFVPSTRILTAGAALLCIVAWYFAQRVLPKVESAPMRVAVALYACVSFVSLLLAAGLGAGELERLLYAVGIACIVGSDTMIAENDFVGNKNWGGYIMPTYYLCHIFVAASAVAGMVAA